MTGELRAALKAQVDAVQRGRFTVVYPLETDLMDRCVDLEARLKRARERARRLERSRDEWRARAQRAERDLVWLRKGNELLKRLVG